MCPPLPPFFGKACAIGSCAPLMRHVAALGATASRGCWASTSAACREQVPPQHCRASTFVAHASASPSLPDSPLPPCFFPLRVCARTRRAVNIRTTPLPSLCRPRCHRRDIALPVHSLNLRPLPFPLPRPRLHRLPPRVCVCAAAGPVAEPDSLFAVCCSTERSHRLDARQLQEARD